MKVRYKGKSFFEEEVGIPSGLTDGKVYDCLGVDSSYALLINDDDPNEEYNFYSPITPGPSDFSSPNGVWEIMEDDENRTLARAIPSKIMKLRYKGKSFGWGLTDGKVYDCLGITIPGFFVVIDDDPNEEAGSIYSPSNPAPFDGTSLGGVWEVVEDDEFGSLAKLISQRP
jgi:hypothetical protein